MRGKISGLSKTRVLNSLKGKKVQKYPRKNPQEDELPKKITNGEVAILTPGGSKKKKGSL